jgi:NADPH-dependent glutamate synthase beta subunit-like oxidoreductase
VAVIGAGPAGLTAAYYLVRLGHSVTVFESQSEPGGMLRSAIPRYRLPREVLQAEIQEIVNAGVDIRTGTEIHYIDGLFDDGYSAVFVAIGAQNDIKIGIEGEEDNRFLDRLAFLRDVNTGKKVALGDRVAVIGGGHAAIDVARTARRLGAGHVTIIYRRTRDDMPAGIEEVDEAVAEGIDICELAMPGRVINEDNGITLECVRMSPGGIDSSGRRRSVPVEGSEFIKELDNGIASIGQRLRISDRFYLPTGDSDFIKVDKMTLATPKPGVFAGGDAVLGPSSVIEAIAHGRQAAKSIDMYLGGSGDIGRSAGVLRRRYFLSLRIIGRARQKSPVLPLEERLNGFSQVELGFDREAAIEEAGRCLRCDLEQY